MPHHTLNDLAFVGCSRFEYDSEVLDWVTRVGNNGGSVSQGTKDAVDTFMKALKAAGLRSKIARLNPYAGTGLAAAMTPLIKDIGGTTDTNNFTEGEYSESTGVTSGGAHFLSTGAPLSALYALDGTNHAMSYGLYVRSSSNASALDMGTFDGTNYSYLSVANTANTYYAMTDNGAGIGPVSDSNGHGFYLGVRLSTSSMKVYKNGSQLATTTTPGSLTSSAINIFVHCANNNNGGGGIAVSPRALGGYQLGTDFDATQNTNLYNAWQALETALGRNV